MPTAKIDAQPPAKLHQPQSVLSRTTTIPSPNNVASRLTMDNTARHFILGRPVKQRFY